MMTNLVTAEIAISATSQDILADLWRRRLDTLISGIANGDPYYLQIANAAEHISAESQGRFLIELIQNANDQAVREGLTDSFVTITRTERLIAVGNSGQPFDQGKVDSITSIFKSDKTADVCIGNKGIGFKAVFQITDSAEIFSSRAGGNLGEGCEIAFRMVRRPFDDAEFVAEMRKLTNALLKRDADRYRAIEKRFPNEAAVDVILHEAGRAAGFTFPLPSPYQHFRWRIQQLGLSTEVVSTTQTLIVLPLDDTGPSSEHISQAIDEMQGNHGHPVDLPPAASFLFLPGIGRIDVVDRVRGFRAELVKNETCSRERLANGVVLRRQRTTCRRFAFSAPGETAESMSQDWWVAERLVGGRDHGDDEKATRERQALREAIQALRLPEENWKDVEQVPVAVALPIPAHSEGDKEAKPLGANGRFCIGLPTQVRTGVPLWVSAHFHGKIDRTEIYFQNAYNNLLFRAVEDLAGTLIDRLKSEPSKTVQHLVTLAMEREKGELASAFYSDGGLARTAVVLGADGGFIQAKDLSLPKASDLTMFEQLVRGISDINTYGFRLPDALLLANARNVLDGLAEGTEADEKLYLQRPAGLPSILEHAAVQHRANGQTFWEPFLTWVLTRLGSAHLEALEDQAILPTGGGDLAKPSSRVFFTPMSAVGRATEEKAEPHAIDDAGDELSAIAGNVALLLRFFDDSAIRVRTGTARDYAPLAQKLAPISGGGLVRRPRQADLINDALIPALNELKGDNDRALALLRQALLWLVGMPQKSKQRVSTDEMLVPVRGLGDAWGWVEPDQAYVGVGWGDDSNVDLITKAFGTRPNSQLVPWDRFERKALQLFGSSDRSWWFQRMKEIGVWDCPRVIRSERRLQVMRANSYSHLTVLDSVRCPTPCADGVWTRFLSRISQRPARTKSGYEFYLKEVNWIDGLEIEAIRPVVVEAMLRRPDRYKPHECTTLARWGGEDSSDVPSLWIYALQSEDWKVIPTSDGLRSPTESWFLPLESRSTKADRFAFLPCVRAEFSVAREFLKTLGVVTLDEAGVPRLVHALHELADRVKEAESEVLRHISALAHDLYEAIQVRLKGGEPADALKKILDHPVPLLRGEKITCANLKEIECVYIDDDTIRRWYIDDFDECWVIPKRSHQTYNDLIDALRHLLGAQKVIRVSECEINVQFNPLEQGVLLLDYVRNKYPGRPLAEEIALLIVKGGTQATSPHEDMFRQAWGRIRRTRVIRGTFEGNSSHRACFDAQHSDGPALLVGSRLPPHEIVGEIWQLVGPYYRDIWAAYAQALMDSQTDRFFDDRGVSTADRTEVETAIGLGFEQLLRRYQPVCLALWRRGNLSRSCDGFHTEWTRQARAAETTREWLSWGNVQAAIELAVQRDEPAGSLLLLADLKLSVREWQQARRELGATPFRFDVSERKYQSSKSTIASHLMAWFAYLVVPRASGTSGPTVSPKSADAVLGWVEQLRQLSVPDDVTEEPLEANIITARVAADALRIADDIPEIKALPVLLDPLQELSKSAPLEITSIKLKDEPDKASTVYEHSDEATRAQQAAAAVDSLLKIAGALAAKYGEIFDAGEESRHTLVALLSQGPWANRISVLAAVRYALEKAAPKTASRMKERQAFRDVDDWRTLWQKFEELGEIPKPVSLPPARQKFDILGSGWTEDDFNASAAQGPAGTLVQRLQESVIPNLDLAIFRAVERENAPVRGKKSGSGGGGGSALRKRTPEAYLKMLGALGEHFVYQQMKESFPDLDLTNWRSKAKELFGYGEGDDSLGYDFEYHDMGGKLTGDRSVPRCLIEVKSTTQDGDDAFEMTTNEWETAMRCHGGSEKAVYVIVRVARTASKPQIMDILIDPIQLHLDGVLDYSSRDLLVTVGKARPIS
jgi:hypothetical protein